jgi:hypothetical protein
MTTNVKDERKQENRNKHDQIDYDRQFKITKVITITLPFAEPEAAEC